MGSTEKRGNTLARQGAIVGALLALGAPLGWAVLAQVFAPASPDHHAFAPVLYAYLTLPSLVVLPVFGWFLGKHADRLEVSLEALSQAHREFERLSRTDHETGLFNERGFTELLVHAIAQSRRNDAPLAIVVWDLDTYHALVGSYGRACARSALMHMTSLAGSSERTEDLLARIGTEAFAALLPATDLAGARVVAERLMHEVRQTSFRFEGQRLMLSVSAGYAELAPGDDARTLLSRAEVGLHQAQRMGGNVAVPAGGSASAKAK